MVLRRLHISTEPLTGWVAVEITEKRRTTELIGADDELQTILTELETLAEGHDDEAVQKHIDQAYENVAFHAEKPGSLLPDAFRDTLE